MRRGCRNLNVQEIANLDGLGGDAVLARVAELANRAAVFFDLVDDLGVALADGRLDNVQSSLKALKFKNKENQKKKKKSTSWWLPSSPARTCAKAAASTAPFIERVRWLNSAKASRVGWARTPSCVISVTTRYSGELRSTLKPFPLAWCAS